MVATFRKITLRSLRFWPTMSRIGFVLSVYLFVAVAHGEDAAEFRFGTEAGKHEKNLMFPSRETNEVPRYVYLGQLTGEENFVVTRPQGPSISGFFKWLAGVGEEGALVNVLQRPQSGVVDEAGRILVTDVSRAAVYVFDLVKGELEVWEKAFGHQNFVGPVGIALAENGDAFVADAELGMVVRLDRAGNAVGMFGKGKLQRPTGLAFDAVRFRLYVADTAAHDIKVFEKGELVDVIGRFKDEEHLLSFPTFMALHDSELYVSDTMNARVTVMNPLTGEFIRTVGKRGLYIGNLVRPKGLALDSEGNLYVVESYYDHLLVFNRSGQFLMAIGGGAGKQAGKYYLPSGVWTDARNRVFLADTFNGRIVSYQFLGGGVEYDH